MTRDALRRVAQLLAGFVLLATGVARATQDDYHIKPGDILQISVWREPDLQLEVLVRPDGGMSMPLAGDLVAEGRTPADLGAAISARLEQFIPDAVVSVALREIRGNSVYVIGRVQSPGEFVMHKDLDVMQALAMAGGTTTFAKLNSIRILRRDGDTQSALPFRYDDVARGESLDQNILLRSGDLVVVP